MSEFWANADEVSTAILGMFENTFEDKSIEAKMADLRVLLTYVYSDPDITIWMDSRDGNVAYGSGDPPENLTCVSSLARMMPIGSGRTK